MSLSHYWSRLVIPQTASTLKLMHHYFDLEHSDGFQESMALCDRRLVSKSTVQRIRMPSLRTPHIACKACDARYQKLVASPAWHSTPVVWTHFT